MRGLVKMPMIFTTGEWFIRDLFKCQWWFICVFDDYHMDRSMGFKDKKQDLRVDNWDWSDLIGNTSLEN